MRALAAYDGSSWIPPSAVRGWDQLEAIGFGLRPGQIRRFVDPLPKGIRPRGESEKGLELRRHPIAMLRDMPELHDLAIELLDGCVPDQITPEDLGRRSNAEILLIQEFKGAQFRRIKREGEMGRRGEGAPDGDP